jgi:membrane protease YdiL (CAAX protease family)
LSELVAGVEAGASGFPRRLKILGVLIVSIVAVGAPVLFSELLYTPDGVSTNGLITHLLLPTADGLVMLLIVLLAKRTGAVGKLELAWFRRSRLDVAAVLFLPVAALLLMLLAAWLMDKLGFEPPMNRMFTPEGRDFAFFVALAVRIVVLTPILEEVFWRGFVQRALERLAGPLPALLGQAVLFASIHQPPFGRFGPALALGLVAGLWRWRRRTLVPIILAHILLNGLYCAGHWPHWQDYAKVRIVTDCVAQMTEAARPPEYDPNTDARDWYERGFRAAVKMPEMLGQYRRGFPVTWPEEAFAQVRRWVAANEEALEYMAQGARKPSYWPVYAGNSAMLAGMPHSTGARDLAFALDARMKLRAFDGQDDLLIADMATLYRFACHFGGVKVLSHQLVGVSIRSLMIGTIRGILASESLEPQTLAAIQQQLEQLGDRDRNTLDFTHERLVWRDGIQRMFTDDGNGHGRIPRVAVTEWEGLPEPFRLLIDPLTPGQNPDFLALDRNQTTQCAEAFLGHIETAAAKTPWDFHNEPNGVKGVLSSLLRENVYVGLLGAACLGVIELPWRARVDLDALVATIAAIRYEAEHGKYPDSLTQLVEAGLLRRVPRDPYSQGPLIYKRGEGGFLLYSCGLDFDDDGGIPSRWGDGPEGGDQLFWPAY